MTASWGSSWTACSRPRDGFGVVSSPIGSLLSGLGLYSGATVLGDGGVVLILDLRGLLRAANIPPMIRESQAAPEATADSAERYLVCGTASGRRVAVPLGEVVRLEQHRRDAIESAGGRRVVRRGDLFTTLCDADELVGGHATSQPATLNVVVLGDHRGGVGITVGSIVDVLAAESRLHPVDTHGVAGILSLGGMATELLDLDAAAPVEAAAP
jgi:two-component system chemotaxis sensor kinase CheA